MLPAAARHQPPGDVVAQALAILLTVAWRQSISGFVKELADQQ